MRRRYLTRDRVTAIESGLSERDHLVMVDVARVNLASGKQLRQLHYEDTDAGRRLARLDLARLVSWRVLSRLALRRGGVRAGSEGFVYALDVAGQRIVHPQRHRYRSPWTPQPHQLRHALVVSDLYVGLRTTEDRGSWHLVGFDAEPSCWRPFAGPGGSRLVLKPDAYVVTLDADYEYRWFVEVDRATEALPRITDKAKTYVRYWQSGREQESHGLFPRVLWAVPDDHRQEQLVEALARLSADHWQLFSVTTTGAAVGALSGGARPTLEVRGWS